MDSNKLNPSTIYYKAEIYRLYECATLSGVAKEIENLLGKADEWWSDETNIDDIYFAHLL